MGSPQTAPNGLFHSSVRLRMKRLFSQVSLLKAAHVGFCPGGAMVTSYARLGGCLAVALFVASLAATAQRIDGLWDASVVVNGVAVPFQIAISTQGEKASSYFFNGEEKANPSTEGSFQDGRLALEFASYATQLNATLKDGVLTGSYDSSSGNSYPFHAQPHKPSARLASDSEIPNINGLWEIQVNSPKGESAWRFLVKQSGAEIFGAILRVDGDTGTLAGSYKDGKFVLSHFTGERPFYLEVTPLPGDSLKLEILSTHDNQTLVALRPEAARLKGLAPPDDPTQHTMLKDPTQPFHFSFPDLTGQTVSERDSRFRGKVVLVNITGSWCPNCHDEAPFLENLYRKYHAQGLEIVALDFEPPEQLKDPSRLRAFIRRYGIEYTYLIAGEPSQLNEKLPQAVNLNAWPTTFFVGRDGLVREIHTGFTSQASGELDTELKAEITNDVTRLLTENAPPGGADKDQH
jgi:thiol-disulfide isomerase/thioredoxin